MPEMRTPEGRERLTTPVARTYEPGNEAIYARRRRRGGRGPGAREIRNGLPGFRPYVYRGAPAMTSSPRGWEAPMPEAVPGTLAEALAQLQGHLPRVAKTADAQPFPCCPHCVHWPGYVHEEPCPRPEQHVHMPAPREGAVDA